MADLIFEIGTEELPASFIGPTAQLLGEAFKAQATAARLTFGAVETHGTPRRIALLVRELAEKTPDAEERGEGPGVSQAFDAEGKPTKAAEGFAKKYGLTVDQLDKSTGRLVAVRKVAGQSAQALLPDMLAKLIVELAKNRKTMRWGNEEVAFPRPVRWICAVFAGEIVPVKFGDVTAQGVTYGHRFLAPQSITLQKCDEYLPKLLAAKVIADIAARRTKVIEEIDRVAESAGGHRVADDELVDTITGLVEWPSGVLGSFKPDALDMPREVLISEMRGHQKYASIETTEGKLLPSFVAVANTPVKDVSLSRRGYERVLASRLSDARFFFDEDRLRKLSDRIADLKRVTFQEKLGSYHDKIVRMLHAIDTVAPRDLLWDQAKVGQAKRVAELSKADLTTGMVGEFPELQGVMGREYARHDKEDDAVAVGVFEHYLPRGASDDLPKGDLGALVGILDRLDTIAGIFAIGKSPQGANDPFALRRACLGVIRIVLAKGYRLKVSSLVSTALALHYERFATLPPPPAPKPGEKKKDGNLDKAEAQAQIIEFFRGRLKALWTEEYPADVVEAVLAAGYDDLVDAAARLSALSEIKGRPDFIPIALAFGRASNIIEKQAKDLVPGAVDPSLFRDAPEAPLLAASQAAGQLVDQALKNGDYRSALKALADLRPAVDLFFDKVLVMAEDPALKQNRLRLVQGVQKLFAPIAEFGKIQTK